MLFWKNLHLVIIGALFALAIMVYGVCAYPTSDVNAILGLVVLAIVGAIVVTPGLWQIFCGFRAIGRWMVALVVQAAK